MIPPPTAPLWLKKTCVMGLARVTTPLSCGPRLPVTDIIIVTLLSVWNILYSTIAFCMGLCLRSSAWDAISSKNAPGWTARSNYTNSKGHHISGISFTSSEFSWWDGLKITYLFLCICFDWFLLVVTGAGITQLAFVLF